jgi:hypothetical protein
MNCKLCGSIIRNFLHICESCYILRINKVLEMISEQQLGETET